MQKLFAYKARLWVITPVAQDFVLALTELDWGVDDKLPCEIVCMHQRPDMKHPQDYELQKEA